MTRELALRRLDQRAQTRAELDSWLTGRGADPDSIRQVLDRFEQVGLIDDAGYARAWAQSRREYRQLSRRAIAQELRTKGVAAEIIESVTADFDQESELTAATELARRRAATMSALPREVAYRRLSAALARRGFSPHVTLTVVRDILDLRELAPED